MGTMPNFNKYTTHYTSIYPNYIPGMVDLSVNTRNKSKFGWNWPRNKFCVADQTATFASYLEMPIPFDTVVACH